ncbi:MULTISPECIES: hypothetical protein [Bradyrhizobium]|jgi:hypothetical protein|uniref:Uncharacterized protein n=2 Tax=Bradyrhizobium TaxID=374 RepID=A0ABY0Q2C0_9BRAD|nr:MULTISPECIES: hypothetical protein [Bradyrhizobium]SDJ38292.1 hypothetical protein SAMN05444163_5277 [Bradyrhizobium ottawaense]SEC62600.1 hypothetical protein SAMN05444171_1885 [Bradyrhizobium lablabi]SHK79156.1 hypothetical protein SAMN05444321_0711 [Bradyrhizobium lablabi]
MNAISQMKSRFLLPLLDWVDPIVRFLAPRPAHRAAVIAVTVAASGNPTGV